MLTQVTDSKVTTTLSIIATIVVFLLNLVFKIQIDDVAKAAMIIAGGIIFQLISHQINDIKVTVTMGVGALAVLLNSFLHLNIPDDIQKSFTDILLYVLAFSGIFLTDRNKEVSNKPA
jgi:hypothetical protein